ncbi:MAG: T9SS type A sorting domain-containing protein, partial [Bacteroidetes bacterium]|nr:T9SS type A sorting domain-containing protein [Bacteroidota bacterium]
GVAEQTFLQVRLKGRDEKHVARVLFVSHDAGATWEGFNAGLPEAVMVTDLAISPMDRSLRVGTHGNGMWKRSIDRVIVANEPGSTPTDFALESIIPNPVRTNANVAFRLGRFAHVRVAVYDLRGREVAVLVDRSLAAGRHVAQFRTDGLASGSYVFRLEVDGKVQTQRVTVVR